MRRLRDWTRGLADFLWFVGWFFLVAGTAFAVMRAMARSQEVGYIALAAVLGFVLGALCLAIGGVWRRFERRQAPNDHAV